MNGQDRIKSIGCVFGRRRPLDNNMLKLTTVFVANRTNVLTHEYVLQFATQWVILNKTDIIDIIQY